MATQLISQVEASNAGHPPAPWGDCVVPVTTVVLGPDDTKVK